MTITEAIEKLEHLRDNFNRPYRMTCTNGNGTNGIGGSRISVYRGDERHYIDVPRRNGWKYVRDYPGGEHAKKAVEMIERIIN